MFKLKNDSGITVIMLIVTIVVLIILGGVIIAMLIDPERSSSGSKADMPKYERYQIDYCPLSDTEISTKDTFYVDLKERQISHVSEYSQLTKPDETSKEKKKINYSTNKKLINLIKEYEKDEKDKEEEFYYDSNNNKYKIISFENKNTSSILNELFKIFEE